MAKYKRVMGCGCVIGLDYDDTLAIHYCAKHKAALDMYNALKALLEGSEIAPLKTDEPIRVWTRATPSSEAILEGFNALAKAEGK